MAFEQGHSKIGGRKKGTPNKVTLIKADDLLLELDVNPIQTLEQVQILRKVYWVRYKGLKYAIN